MTINASLPFVDKFRFPNVLMTIDFIQQIADALEKVCN